MIAPMVLSPCRSGTKTSSKIHPLFTFEFLARACETFASISDYSMITCRLFIEKSKYEALIAGVATSFHLSVWFIILKTLKVDRDFQMFK
jgi:hypothetical protein